MARFLARRLLFAVVLVLAVSSAALLLTRLAPGDVTSQLGPFAPREEVERTRARFGLDEGPLAQWGGWLASAARLDFGDSFLYNRPVGPLVLRAAGNTAILGLTALVLATLAGVPLGIFTGTRRGGTLPGLVRAVSLACISLPPLLTSLAFVFVAARTGWLPAGNMTSPGATDAAWTVAWLVDVAWHLPLPALALALPVAATLERLQAQSMGEVAGEPFLLAGAARGLSHRRLVLRHAWPVAVRPVCAVYGLVIGALLSGSFIVEYVTAWPGLGRLMYEALTARDIYLVAACAATGGSLLAVGTFVGDVLLVAADPRIREA